MELVNNSGKTLCIMLGYKGCDEPDYWWVLNLGEKENIKDHIIKTDCYDIIQISEEIKMGK